MKHIESLIGRNLVVQCGAGRDEGLLLEVSHLDRTRYQGSQRGNREEVVVNGTIGLCGDDDDVVRVVMCSLEAFRERVTENVVVHRLRFHVARVFPREVQDHEDIVLVGVEEHDVRLEHAVELFVERRVAVLVVGHADDRCDEDIGFAHLDLGEGTQPLGLGGGEGSDEGESDEAQEEALHMDPFGTRFVLRLA